MDQYFEFSIPTHNHKSMLRITNIFRVRRLEIVSIQIRHKPFLDNKDILISDVINDSIIRNYVVEKLKY